MKKVSIIVPCYNQADFLVETIRSILQQSQPEWELILVDDGSKDHTWDVIQRFAAQDPRVRGFQKENGGTSRARNYGFAKSDPESTYLFFLDHDDQLVPTALETMSTYLDTHPQVGLLGCQYQGVGVDGRHLGPEKRSRWVPGWIAPRQLRDDEYETPFVSFFCATGQGPFAMYRRSVYLQTEGWETLFWPHEDTDIFCQMALITKVHFLPDRLYLKREHPTQGMSDTPRVQKAYVAFRARWDNWPAKNAGEAVVLSDARRHYYRRHRPFRNLKVVPIALKEFLKDKDWGRLRWAGGIIVSAGKGFLGLDKSENGADPVPVAQPQE
jgi:glycosyltransferase involved in cell wall biosynthesis